MMTGGGLEAPPRILHEGARDCSALATQVEASGRKEEGGPSFIPLITVPGSIATMSTWVLFSLIISWYRDRENCRLYALDPL